MLLCVLFFFFKQKTAYEMRISDWSSDVCSSDLKYLRGRDITLPVPTALRIHPSLRHSATGLDLPAMVAAAVSPDGQFTSIQRTYLTADGRSEERRVGKECVSTCRSRWSPYH